MSSFSLDLFKSSLLQIEPISNRDTVRVIPSTKSSKQKIVVGDDSGTVSMYEFKRGTIETVFSQQVFDAPVSSVALGSGSGADASKDKILVSSGQQVVGLSRKGKSVYKLTSSSTEDIKSIYTSDTRIWMACECIYSVYDDDKDRAYYMCPTNINGLDVTSALGRGATMDAVLACQDNCLRIMRDSNVLFEYPTESPVTCVKFFMMAHSAEETEGVFVIYGMDNGGLGFLHLADEGKRISVLRQWSLPDSMRAGVACLACFDLTASQCEELIVGREDGRVQVLSMGLAGEHGWTTASGACPLTVAFEATLGEHVRTVAAGFVNSPDFAEVIVATYSGKIVSFTTEPIQERAPGDQYGKSVAMLANENRLNGLKKEVEDLEYKVDKARRAASHGNGGHRGHGNESSNRDDEIVLTNDTIMNEDVNLSASFGLDPEMGQFKLSIEAQRPMDLIILRSPTSIDYVEDPSLMLRMTDAQRSRAAVSNGGDFGTSGVLTVLSGDERTLLRNTNVFIQKELGHPLKMGTSAGADGFDASGKEASGFTLVCRCQPNCRKATFYLFALEGEPSTLTTTVVVHQPGVDGEQTNKAAKVLSFPVRALCLHSRVHAVDHAGMLNERLTRENENEVIKHLTDSTGASTGRKVGVSIVNRGYTRSVVNRVTFRSGSSGSSLEGEYHKPLPVAAMLEWLHHLLDNVPQRLKDDDEEGTFVFKNCLTGIETTCKLEKGALIIESANPSAVAIAKEHISKFATQKRARVKDQVQTEEDSIKIMMDMLWPKLQDQLSLSRKNELTCALDEITTDLGSEVEYSAWMSPEYTEIIKNKATIEKEWQLQTKTLQYIIGTLSDMFVDWWKLRGHDVKERLAEFNKVLMTATHPQNVMDMFFSQAGSPVRAMGQFNYEGENSLTGVGSENLATIGTPEQMMEPNSPTQIQLTDNRASRQWRDAGADKE